MPYAPVTVQQFKEAKPQFQDVEDSLAQTYIDMASRFVDVTWSEGDYQNAIIAMTCHLLTLEGYGESVEADIQSQGGSRLTSLKSGTLSLTFSQSSGSGDEFKDWLGQTVCGRYYLTLLMLNKRGPILLTAGGAGCASGYAKDWPYKFPGVGRG